ncbi:MAG: hypothetical protein LRS43_01330, partial [Desulfurococcales archaeon]|nr:hypothetical protein [Desulfurococcales archaeon]
MLRSLVALALVAALLYAPSLTALAGSDRALVAEEFIEMQKERLAALVSVLRSEGLLEAGGLEEVLGKLEAARSIARERPEEAVAAAIGYVSEASRGISEALSKRGPQGLARAESRALERALEVKWAHLERLKAMVAELESLNATVDERVYSNIREAELLLNQSGSLLEEGNVSGAARLMGEASRLIGESVSILAREVRDEFSWSAAASSISRGLEEAASRLAETIAVIEESIREGRLGRAEQMMERTIQGLDRLSLRLERIIEVLRGSGVPAPIVEDIERVSTLLREARDSMALALDALRKGDVVTALQLLEATRQKLEASIDILGESKLPEKAREAVSKAREAVRERVGVDRIVEARGPENLVGSAEATLKYLESLKERYESGQ